MQFYMGYKIGLMTDDTPLRLARKRRGLSLQDMASQLGVSLGQMSRIERYGTTYLPHAVKLGEMLEMHPAAFGKKE